MEHDASGEEYGRTTTRHDEVVHIPAKWLDMDNENAVARNNPTGRTDIIANPSAGVGTVSD